VLHPEDSIYSPYDAANRTSHHRTDRAGTPVTFIYAMRNAAGYSLRLGGERNRERSNKSACNQDLSLHKLIPFLMWSVSLPGDNGDWAAHFCFKRGVRVGQCSVEVAVAVRCACLSPLRHRSPPSRSA